MFLSVGSIAHLVFEIADRGCDRSSPFIFKKSPGFVVRDNYLWTPALHISACVLVMICVDELSFQCLIKQCSNIEVWIRRKMKHFSFLFIMNEQKNVLFTQNTDFYCFLQNASDPLVIRDIPAIVDLYFLNSLQLLSFWWWSLNSCSSNHDGKTKLKLSFNYYITE